MDEIRQKSKEEIYDYVMKSIRAAICMIPEKESLEEYRISIPFEYAELLSYNPYILNSILPVVGKTVSKIFGVTITIDDSLNKPILTKHVFSPLDLAESVLCRQNNDTART